MTTTRRRAARVAKVTSTPVHVLLDDPDAGLWGDRDAYLAFMADHGWPLPAIERRGGSTTPEHRHRMALSGWRHEKRREARR